MNTILLRLVGPMQAWGVQSRFSVRDTGLEPSKSGVIGLICAALGRKRTDPVGDLSAFRMGVRVDREGRLSRDYQTAQHVLKASGGIKETDVSTRYYLADAAFLVGLESEATDLLTRIQHALLNPVFMLFLGRKSFPPGDPIALTDGYQQGCTLEESLFRYPYIGRELPDHALRLVLEDPEGEITRSDQPISFSERRFLPRRVTIRYIPAPPMMAEGEKEIM